MARLSSAMSFGKPCRSGRKGECPYWQKERKERPDPDPRSRLLLVLDSSRDVLDELFATIAPPDQLVASDHDGLLADGAGGAGIRGDTSGYVPYFPASHFPQQTAEY
ncbi:hypothetical protein THIOKS11870003 [Thiocapsa sp. KS1]|nr:hypothetical protein [Thiocapsa sp. KS1]CRI64306.1 hypothetical protein THIOKS11870003 [Thiocapsa sp. KS1]